MVCQTIVIGWSGNGDPEHSVFCLNSQAMNYVCDNMFLIGCRNGSITTSILPAKETSDVKNLINEAKDVNVSFEKWQQQKQQVQIFTSSKMMILVHFWIEHSDVLFSVFSFLFIHFIGFALVFFRNFDPIHRKNFTLSAFLWKGKLVFAKFQNNFQIVRAEVTEAVYCNSPLNIAHLAWLPCLTDRWLDRWIGWESKKEFVQGISFISIHGLSRKSQ